MAKLEGAAGLSPLPEGVRVRIPVEAVTAYGERVNALREKRSPRKRGEGSSPSVPTNDQNRKEETDMTCIDMAATGRNIRQMMEDAGFTAEDVRNACGFSTRNGIYKWFSGQTMPTIDNFVILAAMFGTTIDRMIVTRPA